VKNILNMKKIYYIEGDKMSVYSKRFDVNGKVVRFWINDDTPSVTIDIDNEKTEDEFEIIFYPEQEFTIKYEKFVKVLGATKVTRIESHSSKNPLEEKYNNESVKNYLLSAKNNTHMLSKYIFKMFKDYLKYYGVL